jgi:hypothetical protein
MGSESMFRNLFNSVCQFVEQRQMFVVVMSAVSVVALLVWNTAASFSSLDDTVSAVTIEPIVDDTFLGIQVEDKTHDQYMKNAGLRLAMNEAFKASNSVRRYQMARISLQDGQHAETGEAAVLVIVVLRAKELPQPPFEPVAIRRWQPDPDKDFPLDELQTMRLISAPNEDDLARLRHVWSGGKFAEVDSLFGSIGWLFAFVVAGMGLVVLAGAYRTFAWQSSRWDRAADVERHANAQSRLQTARNAKQAQRRIDAN